MNQIREHRIQRRLTQSQLADETQLSLRTIQRVESSEDLPKGNTLKRLEEYFEVQFDDTPCRIDEVTLSKIKMINLSVLSFLFLPLLHIILPLVIWKRNSDNPSIRKMARIIVNFQLLWILLYVVLIVAAPFIQGGLGLETPLILIVMLALVLFNFITVILTAYSLSKKGRLPKLLTYQVQLI
ncbi:DUF4870 domain-containing protein [Sanyastnella coralliicola]|uniref:DUF4870 domain-containing protein n=1 Tax=Sanyastnella coralliicola TaxID=3069118 RepID=UPI0027B9FEF6|nr:DUF4870 domain-containing protein [Longitalea sp. SCSIO 12813]